MGWNLDDYEPVAVRLERFWADHPNGRISTDLFAYHPDGDWWIVRAAIWRSVDDREPAATGYAHETSSTRGVNATSALENCETSAVGRALANLGYAPKGEPSKRPSREEMAKTRRSKQPAADRGVDVEADELSEADAKRMLLARVDGDTALAKTLWQRAEMAPNVVGPRQILEEAVRLYQTRTE